MNVYGELTSAQLEIRTADPTLIAARRGRLWYRTDLTSIKCDLGGSADTVALLALAQTFTNKSIDAATNTITNIDNAAVKAGAGIVYSKLSLAASVKASDMNSQAAAAGAVLTADGAGAASYAAAASSPDASNFYENGSLACTVSANALTIALKDKSGADASGSSKVQIGFRNATAATGTYVFRSVSAALSITIPSGTTIGQVSNVTEFIYVYLIDNAGTVELAVATRPVTDEASIVTTTAVSAGASRTTIYSTTARTGVAVRLIGRLKSLQTTAGTWASVPTEITNLPVFPTWTPLSEQFITVGNGFGSTNTRIRKYTTQTTNLGTAITYTSSATNGDSFTINEDGIYAMTVTDTTSGGAGVFGFSLNSSQLTTDISAITATDRLVAGYNPNTLTASYTAVARLKVGDVVRVHGDATQNGATAFSGCVRIMQISR